MASNTTTSTPTSSSLVPGDGSTRPGQIFQPFQAFLDKYNRKKRRHTTAPAPPPSSAASSTATTTAAPPAPLLLAPLTLTTTSAARREETNRTSEVLLPEPKSSVADPLTERGGLSTKEGGVDDDPQLQQLGAAGRAFQAIHECVDPEHPSADRQMHHSSFGKNLQQVDGSPDQSGSTDEKQQEGGGRAPRAATWRPHDADKPTSVLLDSMPSDGSTDPVTNSRGGTVGSKEELPESAAAAESTTVEHGKDSLPKDGGTPAEAATTSTTSWSCPKCTLANPIRSRRCGACHERRPVSLVVNVEDDDEGGGSSPYPPPSHPTPSKRRKVSSPASTSPPSVSPGWTHQHSTTVPNRRRPRRFGGGGGGGGSSSKGTGSGKKPPRSVAKRLKSAHDAEARQDPSFVPTSETGKPHGGYSTGALCADTSTVPAPQGALEHPTNGGAAGTSAVRVSTSPFVSVLPVPVGGAASTAVSEPRPRNDRSVVASSASKVPSARPTAPRNQEPVVAAPAAPAALTEGMLRVVREKFEMQNRWFRERVLEGQRRVKNRRDELEKAESELRRAERDWRAFQFEYDEYRRNQVPAMEAGPAMAAAPSQDKSSNRKVDTRAVHFDTPVPTVSVARPTNRLSTSSSTTVSSIGDGPTSPVLLGRVIHSETVEQGMSQLDTGAAPSMPRLQRGETGASSPAPAPASTNPRPKSSEKPSQSNGSKHFALHGSYSVPPPMRRSLSEGSTTSSLPAVDSQATIDPDLDPRYRYALRTSRRATDAAPSAGASAKALSLLAENPSSTAAGLTQVAHATATSPVGTMEPPVPRTNEKPPPLSVSTNQARSVPPASTWNAVWDSTKSSRDFIAPRAAISTVDASTAAPRTAEAATGEWIQAAKHARQNQRDRSKPSEPLWDEDSQQQDQPPRPEEPNFAYQEVVRCKAARLNLPCHDCYSCRAFYAALPPEDAMALFQHSRHRAQHSPSETPQDFWVSDFVDEVEKERQEKSREHHG